MIKGHTIFDIDGTLANIEHRRHYVASKPKNWAAFNRGMNKDLPNENVIGLLKILCQHHIVLLASGRGEESRAVTEMWLEEQGILSMDRYNGMPSDTYDSYRMKHLFIGYYAKLYMRPLKDSRSDVIVKREILVHMRADGYNPVLTFDDRDGVVAMWREEGLTCCQVAPGDF